MEPRVRAIETRYAGCRFRSRLESRWAVFLDRLSIPWEYEPQGYVIDGVAYLPDFHLPTMGKYLEIKGGPINPVDADKVLRLAVAAKGLATVSVLQGDIPRESFTRTVGGIKCFAPDPDGASLVPALWVVSADRHAVDAALSAARSARFEHGESG